MKTKNEKIAIIILATILFSLTSYAQVELYGRFTKDKQTQADFNIYGEKKISEKFVFTYFGMIEQTFAQGYAGVSYSPNKWFSVGLCAGIEQNPALYRMAGSLWAGKEKNSLLALWEKGDGNENYFYKITFTHKFSEHFSLSERAWRFHGEGVVATYSHPKSGISLWVFPSYDLESKAQRVVTGISIKI